MIGSELDVLTRAHDLFAGETPTPTLDAGTPRGGGPLQADLASAARTDAAATHVAASAHRDRAQARRLTGDVVDQARADTGAAEASPLAQREATRRRIARLRTQHGHVLTAHLQARRHAAALRGLRYGLHRGGMRGLPAASGRAATAVRVALSRLGCPYVWGATGPGQFDCSGLVQWSYAHAGVHLERTTYQQIYEGIPVPRSQVRPGDLVFPHAGHVQLAIGNNLVVEAPYPGASVRISPLGASIAIRRPV